MNTLTMLKRILTNLVTQYWHIKPNPSAWVTVAMLHTTCLRLSRRIAPQDFTLLHLPHHPPSRVTYAKPRQPPTTDFTLFPQHNFHYYIIPITNYSHYNIPITQHCSHYIIPITTTHYTTILPLRHYHHFSNTVHIIPTTQHYSHTL